MNGTREACAAGTINNRTGRSDPCTDPCPAGTDLVDAVVSLYAVVMTATTVTEMIVGYVCAIRLLLSAWHGRADGQHRLRQRDCVLS